MKWELEGSARVERWRSGIELIEKENIHWSREKMVLIVRMFWKDYEREKEIEDREQSEEIEKIPRGEKSTRYERRIGGVE